MGDILNIQVWKEPDLTRSVPVRPDGKISFPLLDDIQAAGLSPIELKAILVERPRQFLSEPRVTVLVEEVNDAKIYVMGEVVTPVSSSSRARPTSPGDLAFGRLHSYAKRNDIVILRNNGKSDERISVSYEKILNGKSPEQNLLLEPGDTVVVP